MEQSPEVAEFDERIASPGWVETPGGIAVTGDLECGSAADIRVSGPLQVSLAPGEDRVPHEVQVKGPISCYNVCLLLESRADLAVDAQIEVRIPHWLTQAGFDYFLRKPYLTCRAGGDPARALLDWEEIPPDRQRATDATVEVAVTLGPGERRVLSTVAHYPWTSCCERMERIAARHDGWLLREIGKSLHARPILSLEAGDPSAPRAVFTGTLQPGEPSAWGVLAMAEAALKDKPRWLDHYRLCFVPQTNPDGIVLGRCNVNAADEMAAFGFEEAAQGRPCARESEVLWQYLAADPPVVYVDFHFLRLPNHPLPKPYFFDQAIYRERSRANAAVRLNRALMALNGVEQPYAVPVGHEMWRRLASYQAAAQLDTVSFLYQYTGPTTSYKGAQQRGPEVMRAALEACAGL